MAKLSREDAMRFYKRYLRAQQRHPRRRRRRDAPRRSKRLAEETYGKVPANPEVDVRASARRSRRTIAARRLELKDPRAGNASFHRYYVAPSYTTAKPGEAEALDLLMKILADGSTSRLYRKLVVEDKIASTAGGDYSGCGLDGGTIALYAVAADGDGLDKVEAAIDGVLADIREQRRDRRRTRARQEVLHRRIHLRERQPGHLARRYGWGLAVGRTVADIDLHGRWQDWCPAAGLSWDGWCPMTKAQCPRITARRSGAGAKGAAGCGHMRRSHAHAHAATPGKRGGGRKTDAKGDAKERKAFSCRNSLEQAINPAVDRRCTLSSCRFAIRRHH